MYEGTKEDDVQVSDALQIRYCQQYSTHVQSPIGKYVPLLATIPTIVCYISEQNPTNHGNIDICPYP